MPIPPAVICALLGLPLDDSRRFQDASNRMVRCSTSGDRAGLAAAVEDMFGYLHEQIDRRRGTDTEDLLAAAGYAADEIADLRTEGAVA